MCRAHVESEHALVDRTRTPTRGERAVSAYVLIFPQDVAGFAAEDPTEINPYADRIEQTMAPYGGRYLRLREHPMEVLEGDWRPPLGMGMIEFPSVEQAKAWYDSPEYREILPIRQRHARTTLILAEGV